MYSAVWATLGTPLQRTADFIHLLSSFFLVWRAAKEVLRYLKGTIDFGLKYTDSFNVELTGYSD